MKQMQEILPSEYFSRVHKSYIINDNKIQEIENNHIILENKRIPIGASYRDGFIKKLNIKRFGSIEI